MSRSERASICSGKVLGANVVPVGYKGENEIHLIFEMEYADCVQKVVALYEADRRERSRCGRKIGDK